MCKKQYSCRLLLFLKKSLKTLPNCCAALPLLEVSCNLRPKNLTLESFVLEHLIGQKQKEMETDWSDFEGLC